MRARPCSEDIIHNYIQNSSLENSETYDFIYRQKIKVAPLQGLIFNKHVVVSIQWQSPSSGPARAVIGG